MKRINQLIAVFLTVIALTSCGSSSSEPEVTPTTLTSFSPTTGPKTTIVTISGTNFGPEESVQVFFNDKEATIQSVSVTEIVAVVPPKAFTGIVKVISNGTELTGGVFTYTLSDINVTTIAGSTYGYTDGSGSIAQFKNPIDITINNQGNLFIADNYNDVIRKVTPNGDVVSTFAGSDTGYLDGTGTSAQFYRPYGIISDAQGTLYVTDSQNHKIRKITPSGVVSTLAGSTVGYTDGNGTGAQFSGVAGIAIDSEGNLFVCDSNNHKIRKITPNGEVSTFAGGESGYLDGSSTEAQFSYPSGIAIDKDDNIYVSDVNNHKIRKITPNGEVSTFAGGEFGYANGLGTEAQFNRPAGLITDKQGNLFVCDRMNNTIRKITPEGMVSTLAGIQIAGNLNGAGNEARFSNPTGITVDALNDLYVVDNANARIRKITIE